MEAMGIDATTITLAVNNFLERCTSEEIRDVKLYQDLRKDRLAFESYGRYPLMLLSK
jgi:hypothetical protein